MVDCYGRTAISRPFRGRKLIEKSAARIGGAAPVGNTFGGSAGCDTLEGVDRLCAAIALLLVGCGGGATLVVGVALAPGVPQPASLRLSAYGAGRVGTAHSVRLIGNALPGTLVLQHLDATAKDFRIVVDGLDAGGGIVAQAASRAPLRPDASSRVDVTLTAGALPDGDGDGVPDLVDDCPGADDAAAVCVPPSPPDLAGAPPDLGAAGAPPSCPAGAIACDDFEGGPSWRTPPWSTELRSGATDGMTLTIDDLRPHTGRYAAHLHQRAGLSGTLTRPVSSGLVSSGIIALRAWVYFPVRPTASVWLMRLGSSAGYDIGGELGGATVSWTVASSFGGKHHISSAPLQANSWDCVELVYDFASSRLQLFVGGSSVIDVSDALTPLPLVDQLLLGATMAPTWDGDLWIDDFALARGRLGCQ